MSPEARLFPSGELDIPIAEFDPEAYVDSLRELLQQNPAALLASVSAQLAGEVRAEQEKSRTFIEEGESTEIDPSTTPEAITRISEGFSSLMGRVVRLSARARHNGQEISPFTELDETVQDNLRNHVLAEYLGLCDILAGNNNQPSKMIYQKAPFLYIDPETVEHLMTDNDDLGRWLVARLITHNPLQCEEVIKQVRERIEEAYEKFPTISQGRIRKIVAQATGDHEAALRKYAETHGLVVDIEEQPLPQPKNFLANLRQVARDEQYNLRDISLPPEMAERASRLGKQALALMERMGVGKEYKKPNHRHSKESRLIREGISKKVETIALMAIKAWREGHLTTEPSRAPREFREGLYTEVMQDFLALHSLLSTRVSKTSMKENPVEYYAPDRVRQLIGANPDLPLNIIRLAISKNPADPQEAVEAFNERVRQLMAANPRLLRKEARSIARDRPVSFTPTPEEVPDSDSFEPVLIMERARNYLNNSVRLDTNYPEDITAEIKRWRPEIEEYLDAEGWTFGGITLPEKARGPLLKKLESFVVITERAYRGEGMPIKLSNLDAAQRRALYKVVATEFSEIGQILKTRSATQWSRVPSLYMSPAEVSQLREEYSWLNDKDFHKAVSSNISDVRGALQRTAEVKADLQRRYPGMSDAVATDIAIGSPFNASRRAMDYLRKVSEGRARMYNSRNKSPDPKRPEEILRSLKTEFRDAFEPGGEFGSSVETCISKVVSRATDWLSEQSEAEEIDEKSAERFLKHIESYVRASQALGEFYDYPRLVEVSLAIQIRFIKLVFESQRDLNQLISSQSENGETSFRIYEFGFYHEAKYLKQLWKLYGGYLPRNLITIAALMTPVKPIDTLNGLVEYQAEFLKQNPDASPAEHNQALNAKIRESC